MLTMQIKKFYSFEVYSPATIGTNFVNMQLLGEVDYSMVSTTDDLHARHLGAYNELPQGTPREVERLEFCVFRAPDGTNRTLAKAWIRESSVKELSGLTMYATVPNASPNDVLWLRGELSRRGFRGFEVDLK